MKQKQTSSAIQPQVPWHTMPVPTVVERLKTSLKDGITNEEASVRASEYGTNEFVENQGPHVVVVFLSHFFNTLTFILGLAALAAFVAPGGHAVVDGSVIVFVIVTNGLIGFFQEQRSEKTMDSLRKMSSPTARVVRAGILSVIASAGLVPGDIIHLEEGDQCPADIRIFEAVNLQLDEAMLTGEPLPILKTPNPVARVDEDLGDRHCMAYRGCLVRSGRGKGIVASTGMSTEIGKIAGGVSHKKRNNKTPLQTKMDRMTIFLFFVAILLAIVVYGSSKFSFSTEVTLYAVSLAVAILPEGIVAVITMTMALGVHRMAKSKAIVRKLHSLELLGSVSNICSDKTGTLTEGKMNAKAVWTPPTSTQDPPSIIHVTGSGIIPEGTLHASASFDPTAPSSLIGGPEAVPLNPRVLIASACLNITAQINKKEDGEWMAVGDPTEVALAVLGRKACVDHDQLISDHNLEFSNEYAFDSAIKRMTTTYTTNKKVAEEGLSLFKWFVSKIGKTSNASDDEVEVTTPAPENNNSDSRKHDFLVFTKGALESVLSACSHYIVSPSSDTSGEPSQVAFAPKSDEFVSQVSSATSLLASRGLRVLAIAAKSMTWHEPESPSSPRVSSEVDVHLSTSDQIEIRMSSLSERPFVHAEVVDATQPKRHEVEDGLVFLGVVGIYDPPRAETAPAVEVCKKAGIRVHMITGDHPATASSIAKEIGILAPNDEPKEPLVFVARDFDLLTDAQVDSLSDAPSVIARCSPDSKVKMVHALHRKGKRVAMTGDGVNDAPAIKAADVGIAMGIAGSDVTKSAASVVLTNDDFSTLVKAISEGRRIFSNITKFIVHLLSGNVAEIIVLVIGLSFRDQTGQAVFPMSPMQILWLNMLTSSPPALGLGVEPASPDLMLLPPSHFTAVFTREVILDTVVYGTIMGLLTLVNFIIVMFPSEFGAGDFSIMCNEALNDGCFWVFRARCTAFATLSTLLLILAYICTHPRQRFFHLTSRNKHLFGSMVAGFVLTVPTFYIPFLDNSVFKQQGITWEWGLVVISWLLLVLMTDIYKAAKDKFMPISLGSPKAGSALPIELSTVTTNQPL